VRAADPTAASQSRPQAYLLATWKIARWTNVTTLGHDGRDDATSRGEVVDLLALLSQIGGYLVRL
jgi:hypothetical protein